MELWKVIEGFPTYQISNHGRVKNINGRILKCGLNKNGYPTAHLLRHGTYMTKEIHVLVAKAFIKGERPGTIVKHIDNDKTNNHVLNLKWISHQEYRDWIMNTGRIKKLRRWTVSNDRQSMELLRGGEDDSV